jgi:hypothetical protein
VHEEVGSTFAPADEFFNLFVGGRDVTEVVSRDIVELNDLVLGVHEVDHLLQ